MLLPKRPVSEGPSKSTEVFHYINLGEPHPCRSVAGSQSAAGKRRSSDMFKLVVLSGLLAVASAKPSALVSPIVGKLVSEKTIESHGNSVIHASAPVIAPAHIPPLVKAIEPVISVAPVIAVKAAAIVAEKTIESHGHSIIHHGAPAATVSYVAPVAAAAAAAAAAAVAAAPPPPPPSALLAAAPVAIAESKKFIEKTESTQESLEKSESSQESKQQSIEKIENVARESNQQAQKQEKPEPSDTRESSSEPRQRNETQQSTRLSEQSGEFQGQFVIHRTAPATLSYLAASPIVPALAPVAIVPTKEILEAAKKNAEKSESAISKEQFAERFVVLENGAIREIATGLHLAAAPAYYYSYPSAVLTEKSISSYGHSIVHGAQVAV